VYLRQLVILLMLWSSVSYGAAITVCNYDPGVGNYCPSYQMVDTEGPAPFGAYFWVTFADTFPNQWWTVTEYRRVGSVTGSFKMLACNAGTAAACSASDFRQFQIPTSWVLGLSGGCVPSMRTVDPCPSGFAPSAVVPNNNSGVVDSYPAIFDQVPQQDLTVAGVFVVLLFLGLIAGRMFP